MSTTGKYVPPHLRRAAAALAPAPAPARRGVHFPSDRTGEQAADERHHRYRTNGRNTSPTRAEKAAAVSARLARRTVKANRSARKSTLKGPKKTKRQTRSASPTRKAHSKKRATSR